MVDEIKPEVIPQIEPEAQKLLTPESILPSRKTKKVFLSAREGYVEIQNINYGDLGLIYRKARDDAFEFGMGVIVRGLINPKIGWERIKGLDPNDATLLVTEIMELSGYSPKAAEAAKKFLRPT